MKRTKILTALFVGGSVVFIMMTFYFYQVFYTANLNTSKDQASVLIKKGDDIEAVTKFLSDQELVQDRLSFRFETKFLKYNDNVKPGHYVLTKNMSNLEAVRLLRSGAQTPVRVTFNNARLKKDLAKKICASLVADEKEFLKLLNDDKFLADYGFDSETILTMFLPNTYEMYWTTDAKGLFDRMKREYNSFWNQKRKDKANELGMTQKEVAILASIVQAETLKSDEKPRVAGVYMNRLKKNMLLQADPTVVFAVGDFSIRRVLNKHLETDSPYNTYKYTGLPPGPINVPIASSIDAVLNYEKHKYIFFCASDEFNGYHNFARTSAEHSRNAAKYQRALNKKKIMK